MKLLSCEIKNFRNIVDTSAVFSEGVNVINGDNAEGKTSILEAVYVFARGRSFRTNKESEFINFEAESSRISIEYSDIRRMSKMTAEYDRHDSRKLYKNGVRILKTSEFIGNFRAVLFTPDHLSLIKDAASERRLFLDIAMAQITPQYVQYIKKYNSLLSQRNALLKNGNAGSNENLILFETLAEQMAQYAANITRLREKYCAKLSEKVSGYIDEMSGGREKAELKYEVCITDDISQINDTKQTAKLYYKKLTENLEREIYFKTSLYGPQKDDIDIKLNGNSSRKYCSQGQQRSLALALKLAEGDISNEVTGEYPVYLLDDVLGELDGRRAEFFMSHLQGKQIIITSCDAYEKIKNADRIITVKNGEVL